MIDWPFSKPEIKNYSERNESGILRTSMSSGKIKKRKLTTKERTEVTLSFILSSTELIEFKSFYKDSINYGLIEFNIPLMDGTKLVRIIENYSVEPVGACDVRVSFDVEYYD